MTFVNKIFFFIIQQFVFDIKKIGHNVHTLNYTQQNIYGADSRSEDESALESIKMFLLESNDQLKTGLDTFELKADVTSRAESHNEKQMRHRSSIMETNPFCWNASTGLSMPETANQANDVLISTLSMNSDYCVNDSDYSSDYFDTKNKELILDSNNQSQALEHSDNTNTDIWTKGPYDIVWADDSSNASYLLQTCIEETPDDFLGSTNNYNFDYNRVAGEHNSFSTIGNQKAKQVRLEGELETERGTKKRPCNLDQNNKEKPAKVAKLNRGIAYDSSDQQDSSSVFSSCSFNKSQDDNLYNNKAFKQETQHFNRIPSFKDILCKQSTAEDSRSQYNNRQNATNSSVLEGSSSSLKYSFSDNNISSANKNSAIKNKFTPILDQRDNNIYKKLTIHRKKRELNVTYIKTPIYGNSKEIQSLPISLKFCQIKINEEKGKVLISFAISKLPIFLKAVLHIAKVGWDVKNHSSGLSKVSFFYRPVFTITAPLGSNINMSQLLPELVFNINEDNFFPNFYKRLITGMKTRNKAYIDGYLCSFESELINNSGESKKKKRPVGFCMKKILKNLSKFKTEAVDRQIVCNLLDDIIKKFEALKALLDEIDRLDCTEDNLKESFDKIYRFEEEFLKDQNKFINFQGLTPNARYFKRAFDMLCKRFAMHKKSKEQCLIYIYS
ncbi:hypothetical protein CDIK_3116 [Cucumispora dikerogammari]|nr:hypothetical protein CDIK_3116 [Cucumispora dikerogammari]